MTLSHSFRLFSRCAYNRPGEKGRTVPEFERRNYVDMKELALLKKGTVNDDADFIETVKENFTLYYWSLIPWVNRLCKVVFPDGGRRKKEERKALFMDHRDYSGNNSRVGSMT